MSKNYLILISIIFLVNCKTDDTSHEKKEVLPYNSITKLILSDNQVEFEKAQVSNLETVNGYRYLKFETNIDSLFYEDWYKETVSNDYTILQKRQDIYVNDENQNRKISLYFVGKNLAKINMSWSKEWDILRSGYSFEQILTTAFGNCTSRIWKDNIDTIIKAHNNSQTMFLPKHRTYLSRKNIYSYSTNFANADDLGIVYYITYCWNSSKIEMKLYEVESSGYALVQVSNDPKISEKKLKQYSNYTLQITSKKYFKKLEELNSIHQLNQDKEKNIIKTQSEKESTNKAANNF